MTGYKYLYVNGCSFTAGHELEENQTWPVLLAESLGLELIQDAKNGNSMETIFHITLNNLPKFDSKETLVVIGTTWKERYSVPYWNGLFNITAADTGQNKQTFLEKTSTWRRMSSPISRDHIKLDDLSKVITSIPENFDNFNYVLRKYTEFYEALVEFDKNLELNQAFFHFNYLYALEKFLKLEKYNYKFIDFQEYFSAQYLIDKNSNINSYNLIDTDSIISLGWEDMGSKKDKTSHPNIEQSKVIAKLIKERL